MGTAKPPLMAGDSLPSLMFGRHESRPPPIRKKKNEIDGGGNPTVLHLFVVIDELRIQHPATHVCQALDG